MRSSSSNGEVMIGMYVMRPGVGSSLVSRGGSALPAGAPGTGGVPGAGVPSSVGGGVPASAPGGGGGPPSGDCAGAGPVTGGLLGCFPFGVCDQTGCVGSGEFVPVLGADRAVGPAERIEFQILEGPLRADRHRLGAHVDVQESALAEVREPPAVTW